MSWDASEEESLVKKPKGTALKKPPKKKKKKKVLKQQPKQKSAFKLKTTKKPRTFAHHAAKSKSKPLPKLKRKPLPKSKPTSKAKTKAHSQRQTFPHYRPNPKISSSGFTSVSGTSRPKSQAKNQSHSKTKSRRTTTLNQNLSQFGPALPKSKRQLKLHFKAKSRQTSFQYQNISQPGTQLPPPTTSVRLQPVWDTSVQAAIRVGDWKLLTGDPGHGDWVPPQVLPTLPGRWWNLERTSLPFYKTSTHKNIWLFNITGDPYERHDLADQRPDVVQQLLARLAYYNQTAVPVYFPPDDPRANPSHHGGAWVPWVDEGEEEEGKYQGVYKKGKNVKKKRKKKKCRLCKLKSFFMKLNTGMMSNRI